MQGCVRAARSSIGVSKGCLELRSNWDVLAGLKRTYMLSSAGVEVTEVVPRSITRVKDKTWLPMNGWKVAPEKSGSNSGLMEYPSATERRTPMNPTLPRHKKRPRYGSKNSS